MALDEAVRRGHLSRNVARIAVLPAALEPPKARRSFTADQARAVLAEAAKAKKNGAHDRLEALWVVALMRGLRPGELLGLTWADVEIDADPPLLHLRESMKFEYEVVDGRRRPVYRLGQLKAGAQKRSLALPDPVVEALRRHRVRLVEERLLAGDQWRDAFEDLGGLVFPSVVGTPLNPPNVRRAFRSLLARAGIAGKWTPYEMRHSAVSLLSDAGVPPEQIADLLGHVDTRMVLKVYRHPVTPVVKGGAQEMQRIFGS